MQAEAPDCRQVLFANLLEGELDFLAGQIFSCWQPRLYTNDNLMHIVLDAQGSLRCPLNPNKKRTRC